MRAGPDQRQQLARALRMALGPARLLRPPGGGGLRQFARHLRSGSIAARQPCIMQRMERSRSSVSVSPVQPPPSSIAARDHTPAVPLKRDRQAGAEARFLLHREMGIEQQALHARQPVGVAVGMAPARLHEGQARYRRPAPARCGAGNRAAARNRRRRSRHRAHRNA